jgi:hypothetical protein
LYQFIFNVGAVARLSAARPVAVAKVGIGDKAVSTATATTATTATVSRARKRVVGLVCRTLELLRYPVALQVQWLCGLVAATAATAATATVTATVTATTATVSRACKRIVGLVCRTLELLGYPVALQVQ